MYVYVLNIYIYTYISVRTGRCVARGARKRGDTAAGYGFVLVAGRLVRRNTAHYGTVCCSVLQCVPQLKNALYDAILHTWFSVLPCVTVCCSVLQCVEGCLLRRSTAHTGAVCCSVLQCVAVYCRVLQCVAVC